MASCRPDRFAPLLLTLLLWCVFVPCPSALAEIQLVIGEGEYRLQDHDTRADAIRGATEAAKRQALEQMAVYEASSQITVLHNHLLCAAPDLYFMHFWAYDAPNHVAQGLRAALDAMKETP